jgi:peptidoglycan biosynthesis protein MviN/MurJ (putative lipid II flippase)
MAPAGGLSLLYIAQQVFGAANQVINKAIAAPTVPVLAEYAVQRDWRSFRQIYRKKLGLVAMITGTGYLAFLFLGERALHFLIGYGDVTDQNVRMLWWLTALLGGVLIGGAIGQLTSIAFYAQGDTKTPTILGVWSYTVYVPIKFIAFFVYGLVGLAVSTILFCLVNGIIQHVALQRRFASNV